MARRNSRSIPLQIPKSDSDSSEYNNQTTSGAATPSTVATSVGKNHIGRGSGQMDVDSDDEEQVVQPGSRSTPLRRASAAATLVSQSMLASSPLSALDDSDIETEADAKGTRSLPSRSAKGKGRQIVLSSDSDSEEEEEMMDWDDESIEDEDEDEGVKNVKELAKSLSSATKGGRSLGKGKGKKLGKTLVTSLKGKGKATPSSSPHFSLEVPTLRRSSSSKPLKTKTVKTYVPSSSDSDASSFAPSDLSLSEDEDDLSDIELVDFLSVDSEDELSTEDEGMRKKKLEKMKKGDRKEKESGKREPPRKGAVIDNKLRKEMKGMTRAEKTTLTLVANHPELRDCWTSLYALPVRVPQPAVQPAGLTQKLLPFQLEGLDWMIKQEKGTWGGGMLADEMGMGKTIQTIALILSDHVPGDKKCTLVLAPTVALMQWKNEIEKFTKGFKVVVFHGSNRADNVRDIEKFDVVLTSYAVLESGFRRENKGFQKKGKLMKEDSILHKVKWHRVILDEAHNIKDRASNTAKASFALQSKYRWCLSGTPLQNRVGELYSLVRFLGADPFAHYMCKKCDCKSLHWLCNKGPCSECRHSGMQHVCFWNNDILKPIQYGGASSGEGKVAFKKLTTLLGQMMLRRTKIERADDMGLPPRVIGVRRDYFTEEEEEIYQSLFKDVKRKFNTYAHEGTVLNNYSNIFTLITRMRQMADHPSLVTKSRTAQPIEHAEGDAPEEIMTCRICLDEAEDAVQTSCRHIFCRECVRQYLETAIEQKPECPQCHMHMTIDLDQEALEQDTTGRQGFLARIDPSKDRTSTKIEALLEELSKSRTEDHTLKTLVFSQFTSMLDMVERRLKLGGFKVARLQGSMTPTARDNTIKYFMNNPDVTVFLISLKAGGVALNLIEASRCIILDPWWNPAVELQAMDRIHRIGQHRPVEITRLIIENSIESRILELQKKKENLASSALGDDDKALGRLTPEDLRFLFSL